MPDINTDRAFDPKLYNEDLAPVSPNKRTWGTWNYASLWISMSMCIPTYMLASSLIEGGMNWWQSVVTIFLGNLIVLIPMILNGHAGTKYGIPFPVFARASFGTAGANIPALLRAIVMWMVWDSDVDWWSFILSDFESLVAFTFGANGHGIFPSCLGNGLLSDFSVNQYDCGLFWSRQHS